MYEIAWCHKSPSVVVLIVKLNINLAVEVDKVNFVEVIRKGLPHPRRSRLSLVGSLLNFGSCIHKLTLFKPLSLQGQCGATR